MIYDVTSAQYQQFLRSSGRRRDDYTKGGKTGNISNKQISKPGGAASTGIIVDPSQRSVASHATSMVVQGVLAFSLLGTIGVDTSPLVAAAGVTGATIGFACKDFGANIVASLALSGQESLRTGNWVSIGSGASIVKGQVVDWDTRYLYLRNTDGHLLHIPNNMILNSVLVWEKEKGHQKPNIEEKKGSDSSVS